MVRAAALCALALTLTAATSAAAKGPRPAPGGLDPKRMALVAADLGGARVTAQRYYKDRDFPSVISFSREFERARVGSTALAYVDSEAEIGASTQASSRYVSAFRAALGTKKGRATLAEAAAFGALSKPTLGRPRTLGVGSDSVDETMTFHLLGSMIEAHFAVFDVDKVLGVLIVVGTPGRHVPLPVVTGLAGAMTTRMAAELSPQDVVLPSISGTPQAGSALTASPGTWSGSQVALSYQWQRCDAAGANCVDLTPTCAPGGSFCATPPVVTESTYVATWLDAAWGGTLRVAVTGRNAYGSATVTSAPTAVVAAAPKSLWPANTSVPTISGYLHGGQTLTATSGTWNGSPTSFTYIWQRCDTTSQPSCHPVGADGRAPTYVLAPADLGSALMVCVLAYNAAGGAGACSAHTGEVS